jgi:hypothetical protein
MGITDTTWGPQLQQESNKFWFYAIATSIMLSLYQVFFGLQPAQAAEKGSEKEASSITNEKGAQEQNEPKETTSASTEKVPPIPAQARDKSIQVYRQLLIDGCDLFIPGATVGWIPAEPLTVGIFMSISTVLAMGSMWPKIQADAAASAKKK